MDKRLKALFFLFMFFNSHGVSYVPATEDIPLMEGMTTEIDPILFDKNQGEVLIIKTSTPALSKEVQKFYKEALKNLGWIALSKGEFKREEQILTISTQRSNGKTLVGFELKETHKY